MSTFGNKPLGIVIRPGIAAAAKLAREVIEFARNRKLEVLAQADTAKSLGLESGVTHSDLAKLADPIVILGGDGTLIGVAHYVGDESPTLVGVNFGNLGFLTELSPSELVPTLKKLFDGKVRIGERSMLAIDVLRANKKAFSAQAVNDAVVVKSVTDPLLDIDCSVDGEALMRLRADGIIVATATGSTAYSLAAGGSIAYPSLPVMLMTPICPHSLVARPLILHEDKTLQFTIPPFRGQVMCHVDGQLSFALKSGDSVCVTKAERKVKFVISPSRTYFEILRSKLNWGIANKSGEGETHSP